MNKLLAIYVALLSFSLYGADKPKKIDIDKAIAYGLLKNENKALKDENLKLLIQLRESLGKLKNLNFPVKKSSHRGLEGFSIQEDLPDFSGVNIDVFDYSKAKGVKGFDKQAINNQIELILRREGFKLNKRSTDNILIDINPEVGSGIYGPKLKIYRRVIFKANGITYSASAMVSRYGPEYASNENGLRNSISKLMDQFLLDYLKANPKKEEK